MWELGLIWKSAGECAADVPSLAQGFLGTSLRKKQIDSIETEIAMTPIAMPVAGLP